MSISILTNIFIFHLQLNRSIVTTNADYLVNAIYFFKQSPLVLKVILQYRSVEILPLIDDTIKEVKQEMPFFLPLFFVNLR